MKRAVLIATSQAFEEREGNDYVRYGTCKQPKEVGEVCSERVPGMCRAPAVCVVAEVPKDGSALIYKCRPPQP